jgi:hypothetical protein
MGLAVVLPPRVLGRFLAVVLRTRKLSDFHFVTRLKLLGFSI